MADTLSDEETAARLEETPGWSLVDGKLHRELEFQNFVEAFGFMAMVALIAEGQGHHPDWSNSWNKVVIDIVNHAAGGITDAASSWRTRSTTRSARVERPDAAARHRRRRGRLRPAACRANNRRSPAGARRGVPDPGLPAHRARPLQLRDRRHGGLSGRRLRRRHS